MAASYCSACGRPIPAGAAFCSACGTPVRPGAGGPPRVYAPSVAAPVYSPFQQGYAPGLVVPGPPASTPQTREWELRALQRLRVAIVLALGSAVVGIAWVSVINPASFLSVSTSTGGSSTVNLQFSPPWYWTAYFVAVAVAAVCEFVLLRTNLRTLSFVDRRFSTPATLSLLAVVGLLLVFLGLGLFFASIVQAIHCAGGAGNPVPVSCILSGGFWTGIGLLAVGAIVALIGYIGVLLGLWRVGTRYDNALIKVGAILLIIPYVAIVGAILILIGVQQALPRISTGAPAGAFG